MIGILIVAAVGIIGFLLTAGIAFGIAGSYQILESIKFSIKE